MEQEARQDTMYADIDQISSLADEMLNFIDDLNVLISYALIVKEFKHNPTEVRLSTQKIIDRAKYVITCYEETLRTETPDELETREDAICDEIDILNYEMAEHENMLDSYLVFHEDAGDPQLRYQFGKCHLIVSDAAEC